MNNITIHIARCKACGYCIRECPKKAISMTERINPNGYQVIEIDGSKCIRCGICHFVCPDCVFEFETEA